MHTFVCQCLHVIEILHIVTKCVQIMRMHENVFMCMHVCLPYSSQAKVDCITVNLMPVKAVIDDHIQRLFDALLNSLRKSINNDVNEIDTFVSSATDTLSQRPQTVDEIGDANAKHSEFATKKKEVRGLADNLTGER